MKRRMKVVELTDVSLKFLLTEHKIPTYHRVISGLPSTAELCKVFIYGPGLDPAQLEKIVLVFEDDSFPEIDTDDWRSEMKMDIQFETISRMELF